MVFGIPFKSKEPAHDGGDDHCGRPQLMCRAPSQGLEKFAGEKLSRVPRILRPGQIGVLFQVRPAGERLAGTIFGHGYPPSEKWPDSSLMVADGVIKAYAIAQDACTPISRELARRPSLRHSSKMIESIRTVPPCD